jgi:hypothetical protein
MKFRGVFESVGMEEWVVDGRECGESEAVSRVMELYRTRSTVREDLRSNAASARERLRGVFTNILNLAAAR